MCVINLPSIISFPLGPFLGSSIVSSAAQRIPYIHRQSYVIAVNIGADPADDRAMSDLPKK